jgi:hypothetical protein
VLFRMTGMLLLWFAFSGCLRCVVVSRTRVPHFLAQYESVSS